MMSFHKMPRMFTIYSLLHVNKPLYCNAAATLTIIITLLKSIFLYFLFYLSRFVICNTTRVGFYRICTAYWPIGARCVNTRLCQWTALMSSFLGTIPRNNIDQKHDKSVR